MEQTRATAGILWDGKGNDRVRAQSALAVIKQHPGLVLFAVSPVIMRWVCLWLVSPILAYCC